MRWFMSGVRPVKTASFGSLSHFIKENAPEGTGTRCLSDCKIEKECFYSAYNNYMEKGLWGPYAREPVEHYGANLTEEIKTESLKKDNPYGRCVWHCDNNVADRHTVLVEFENGVVANLVFSSPASKPCRTLRIVGTKGEIEGNMNDGYLVLRKPDLKEEYIERISCGSFLKR
jgi:hypothetical protein